MDDDVLSQTHCHDPECWFPTYGCEPASYSHRYCEPVPCDCDEEAGECPHCGTHKGGHVSCPAC